MKDTKEKQIIQTSLNTTQYYALVVLGEIVCAVLDYYVFNICLSITLSLTLSPSFSHSIPLTWPSVILTLFQRVCNKTVSYHTRIIIIIAYQYYKRVRVFLGFFFFTILCNTTGTARFKVGNGHNNSNSNNNNTVQLSKVVGIKKKNQNPVP